MKTHLMTWMLTMIVIGCSTSEPKYDPYRDLAGVFDLTEVNGAKLPVDLGYVWSARREVVSGELILREDRSYRFEQREKMYYGTQPPGTGEVVLEGTWRVDPLDHASIDLMPVGSDVPSRSGTITRLRVVLLGPDLDRTYDRRAE